MPRKRAEVVLGPYHLGLGQQGNGSGQLVRLPADVVVGDDDAIVLSGCEAGQDARHLAHRTAIDRIRREVPGLRRQCVVDGVEDAGRRAIHDDQLGHVGSKAVEIRRQLRDVVRIAPANRQDVGRSPARTRRHGQAGMSGSVAEGSSEL